MSSRHVGQSPPRPIWGVDKSGWAKKCPLNYAPRFYEDEERKRRMKQIELDTWWAFQR